MALGWMHACSDTHTAASPRATFEKWTHKPRRLVRSRYPRGKTGHMGFVCVNQTNRRVLGRGREGGGWEKDEGTGSDLARMRRVGTNTSS